MLIRKDSKILDMIYHDATNIEVKAVDIVGTFYIQMLSGILPDLSSMNHRKAIYIEDGQVRGYNLVTVLGKEKKIGYFDVIELKGGSALLLDYRDSKITDEVKRIMHGLWIGTFFYNKKFKGYFLMTSVDGWRYEMGPNHTDGWVTNDLDIGEEL